MSPALIKPEPRDPRPVCNRCFTRHWATEACAPYFAISPLPKAREPMGDAILRESKARMARQAYRGSSLQRQVDALEAERKALIESKTDDRVLKENTKVSWTSAICVVCYDVRYPGRMPTRVKDSGREQCCDCGMPTTDGIYIRADPMTVRYPRVVRDE